MTTRSLRRSSMGRISPGQATLNLYTAEIERVRSGSSDDTSVMDLNLIMGLHRQGAFDGEDNRLYPPATRRPKRRNSLGATVRQPRAARTAEMYNSNHTYDSNSTAGTPSSAASKLKTPVPNRHPNVRKELNRVPLILPPDESPAMSSPGNYSCESNAQTKGSFDDQESLAGRSGVSKRKVTKLEKIQELQEKLEKAKDVTRKAQLEKLELQRAFNEKRLEAIAMEKELDTSTTEIETLRHELSYALQQLDALGKDQRKDRVKILKLTQELSLYANSAHRNGHRSETKEMEEEIKRKDEEIEHLAQTLDSHVRRCKSLQAELEKSREEMQVIRGKQDRNKNENDRAFAEIEEELERSVKENKAIQDELHRVNDMVQSGELERKSQIDQLIKENEALKRGLANQIEAANSTKVANERANNDLQEQLEYIDELKKQNHDLKREMSSQIEAVRYSSMENELFQSDIRELKVKINELEAHNKNLRRELAAQIEAAESSLHEKSQSELMNRQQLINDLELEIEELRENLKTQVEAARAAIRDKEKAFAEIRERDSLVEELDKEIEDLKKRVAEQNEAMQAAKAEKDRILADIRERDSMSDELMKENDEFKRKLSDQAAAIRSSGSANETLKAQIREQESQIEILKKEVETIHSDYANRIEDLQSSATRNETALHEREALIDELEKEIEYLKSEVAHQTEAVRQAATEQSDSSKAEMDRLKAELGEKLSALEEVQRRNAILEEENEEFIMRHNDMESELEFLSGELDQWKAKVEQNTYADGSSRDAVAQQELLLKAAIAQKNLSKRSWGPRISLSHISSMVNGSSDDGSDEKERTIRQLENSNADFAETIKSLKSELVRMNSTYKEEAYVNKKKVNELADENSALACKVAALEQQLAQVNGNMRGDLMMMPILGATPVTPT